MSDKSTVILLWITLFFITSIGLIVIITLTNITINAIIHNSGSNQLQISLLSFGILFCCLITGYLMYIIIKEIQSKKNS
jgi:hypothetical protein